MGRKSHGEFAYIKVRGHGGTKTRGHGDTGARGQATMHDNANKYKRHGQTHAAGRVRVALFHILRYVTPYSITTASRAPVVHANRRFASMT